MATKPPSSPSAAPSRVLSAEDLQVSPATESTGVWRLGDTDRAVRGSDPEWAEALDSKAFELPSAVLNTLVREGPSLDGVFEVRLPEGNASMTTEALIRFFRNQYGGLVTVTALRRDSVEVRDPDDKVLAQFEQIEGNGWQQVNPEEWPSNFDPDVTLDEILIGHTVERSETVGRELSPGDQLTVEKGVVIIPAGKMVYIREAVGVRFCTEPGARLLLGRASFCRFDAVEAGAVRLEDDAGSNRHLKLVS